MGSGVTMEITKSLRGFRGAGFLGCESARLLLLEEDRLAEGRVDLHRGHARDHPGGTARGPVVSRAERADGADLCGDPAVDQPGLIQARRWEYRRLAGRKTTGSLRTILGASRPGQSATPRAQRERLFGRNFLQAGRILQQPLQAVDSTTLRCDSQRHPVEILHTGVEGRNAPSASA